MAEHSRMMKFHSSILQVASIIKNNEQKKAEESFELEKKKKRERKANYSQGETDRLVELLIAKKDILENKKGGADQWQEKKQAWEDIEKAFNKKNDVSNYRDSKTLKIKYESIKRDVKRKWNNILAGRRNSKGKLPKFTTAEKRIKEILNLPIEGFCDFSSFNDKSDDDDDSNSSSMSDRITKDDWTSEPVKREKVPSDDDDVEESYDTDQVKLELPLNAEPPTKKMCRDPLLDKPIPDNEDDIDKKIAAEKLKTLALQKSLLNQEIKEKELKVKMIQEKMTQNRVLFELQKKRLLMEIEAIKNGHLNIRDIDDIIDL